MRHFTQKDSEEIQFDAVRKTQVVEAVQINEPFTVDTLEGIMTGKSGDYLMRGIKGELYVCDKEIFDNSYEFLT